MQSEPMSLSVRGVLESSTLFNALTDNEMVQLAGQCKLYRCDRGEPIWLSGGQASFFGLVGDGFVKMVRSNSSGMELTLEIMGPGQIFGLLGVFEGSGCPLMAYGLTNTAYLRIPKQAFMAIYDVNNVLKDRLVRRTAVRMHQKLDFMAKLSTGKAAVRIAAILFILAESYGKQEGESIYLTVPLTRQAIGEMAGTTTETTIRVLSKWAQEKIVLTDQQQVTICDPARLEMKLH
ncbi:MAG: Crp/Fnr family transcriptional regulator [Armatimonadetes bacterium]|nr:Crp/Fnr family transcriptional regulator [Armatimonadota bacterium]